MDIELDRTINATKTLDFIRYSRNLTYIYATILLFVYVLIFAKDVSMQLLSNNVQAQVNAVIFFEWWISILAPISLIGILTIILFTLMSSNIIKHILFNKANDRKQNSSSHLWGWFVPVASIWIVPKSLSIGEKGKDSLSSKSRIIRFLLIFAHVAPLVVIIGFSIIGILMGSISHVEFMIFNALIGLVVGMVIASSFYILGYYYSCVFKVLVNNEEGYDLDYKKEYPENIQEESKMLPEKVQDISKKDISGNYSKIYELEQLLKDGLITEEEFQELKRKELGLD